MCGMQGIVGHVVAGRRKKITHRALLRVHLNDHDSKGIGIVRDPYARSGEVCRFKLILAGKLRCQFSMSFLIQNRLDEAEELARSKQ